MFDCVIEEFTMLDYVTVAVIKSFQHITREAGCELMQMGVLYQSISAVILSCFIFLVLFLSGGIMAVLYSEHRCTYSDVCVSAQSKLND